MLVIGVLIIIHPYRGRVATRFALTVYPVVKGLYMVVRLILNPHTNPIKS
jgi:hypothetical protein